MSDNQDKCTNYLRLISTVIDLGTEAVLLLFYHLKPREKVAVFLSETQVKSKIENLKKRKILKLREYNLVTSYIPNPELFDLNTLITLISNLFRDEIGEPIKGWDTFPPAPNDFSVGADLLRLRRIKNDIVSHHTKSELPNTIFSELWEETENLLIRINIFVDSEKEPEMKERLSYYATRTVSTVDVSKAMDTVRLWYDQIAELQKQVQELAKTTNAVYAYFHKLPQNSKKYYVLLVDGGRAMLLHILGRESRRCGDTEIKTTLSENKDLLMKDRICADSEPPLFLKDEKEHFDASKLDILVLGTIIMLLFKSQLDKAEGDAISELIRIRRNYAEKVFLTEDSFLKQWTDLIMNLQMLAGQSRQAQTELRDQINTLNREDDNTNADRCIQELTDNVRELKNFEDVYKETTERLHESLRQMKEEGVPFGEEKIVVLKTYIRGSSKQNSDLAEKIVDSTISKALEITHGSNDYEQIARTVDKILDHVRRIDGAHLLSSERGCILLSFGCTCYSGILELIDYFESDLIQDHLNELAFDLSCQLEDGFIIFAKMTNESITNVEESIAAQKQAKLEGYIPLKVSCATASSLSEIYKSFGTNCSPDVLNTINKTAELLSEELNDKCSIEIHPDLGNNWPLVPEVTIKRQEEKIIKTSDSQNGSNSEFNDDQRRKRHASGRSEDVMPHTQDEKVDLLSQFTAERIPIRALTEIRIGDVVSLRYFGFMHDVIVTEVPSADSMAGKGSIKCIHYPLPSLLTKRKIVEECIIIDLKSVNVYKLDYGCLSLNPPETVINRASSRIGEKKWNVYRNRSEHFCFWAKVNSSEEVYSENTTFNKYFSQFKNGDEKEVHLANELQIGDVVLFKDYGILVDVGPLDSETVRKFYIELIVYDKDWYIRRKRYSIDLNKDYIFVRRFRSRNSVSMAERVERAIEKVDRKCKKWTTNGFIKECLK